MFLEVVNKSGVGDLVYIPPDIEGAAGCFDHCVFSTPTFDEAQRNFFVETMAAHGVQVKPFGTAYNARFFKNWKFMNEVPDMPRTETIVRHSFDLKIPFNFTAEDVAKISQVMVAAAKHTDAMTDTHEDSMWVQLANINIDNRLSTISH
eukprot:SAG31_NODE_23700_length_498_cov_0.939850_1_plen_149_part_00